jgi:hypothetical protein
LTTERIDLPTRFLLKNVNKNVIKLYSRFKNSFISQPDFIIIFDRNRVALMNNTITFSGRNSEYGWMSPFSPYHTFFEINNTTVHGHLYKLWSKIIYNNQDNDVVRGYYRTSNTNYNDGQKLDILIKLLNNMVHTHDILSDLLKSTGSSNIIYTVSKFASNDMKWLGYNLDKNVGHNKLGEAWSEVRQNLTIKNI